MLTRVGGAYSLSKVPLRTAALVVKPEAPLALLTTAGADERAACLAVQEGKVDMNVISNVVGQARDMTSLIKLFLTNNLKPGMVRASLYSPLQEVTKENVNVDKTCWSLADIK